MANSPVSHILIYNHGKDLNIVFSGIVEIVYLTIQLLVELNWHKDMRMVRRE
jgi:hypothetical protein